MVVASIRRGRAAVAVAVSTSLLLSACTGSDDEPDTSAETGGSAAEADDQEAAAANDLAAALSAGKLTGVDFTARSGERAQRYWDRVVAGMGDEPPTVRATGMGQSAGADTAEVRLAYEWALPGSAGTWSYEAAARLQRGADGWSADLGPELVSPGLRPGEVLEAVPTQARRGDIVGAGGAPLVTNRPVQRLGIDKANVSARRAPTSAGALARLVDIDPRDFAKRVGAAGDQAFVEAIVLRDQDVTSKISTGARRIAGALAVDDKLPLAPTRTFAAPLLGTVGDATAETIEQSDASVGAGDQMGLSGLQQRYDDRLRGSPGVRVEAVEASGAARTVFRMPPAAGSPLRTTLDLRLQQLADRLLSDVRPASAVVALRPSDGQVLAAASGPGSQGYSTATFGQYAPGSTFKVVSSLALLRAGSTPDTEVSCPPTTTVDGKSFKNYDDYPAGGLGDITLRSAVANSCNTAFVDAVGAVSQSDLAEAAATLGLGVDHDVGFPAYFGSVPDTAGATEHAASAIGQGKVLASPLAMATVAASVAAGDTVVPRLLLGDEGSADDGPAPQSLTGSEAARLRALMRAVVTQGSADFLAGLPGKPVLAKTGTAEYGSGQPLRTHAWMIAARGDLAVAVFVETGQSGGSAAGPIMAEFLRRAG